MSAFKSLIVWREIPDVKVVGCAKNADQQRALVQQAYDLLSQLTLQPRLDFLFSEDELFFTQLQHSLQKVVVIGPELILGNLFDQIGYDEIPETFSSPGHYPAGISGSKLKTVDYLLQ
ncbi:MAG: hypothetical protein WDO71_02420 [Bacteroidota bacterium]